MSGRFLESLLFFFLLLFLLALPSSVAYSEIALGVLLLLRAAKVLLRREEGASLLPVPNGGRLLVPILLWAAAFLLATVFAYDRTGTARKLPKLLLPGLVFFLPLLLTTPKRLRYAAGALLTGGVITSAYGILYYIDDPSTRLGGFVGNYMSTGGILTMISLVAFSLLAVRRIGGGLRLVALFSLPVLLSALYLTNTRGAWLGLFAGLFLIGLLFRPRLVALPLALLLLLLLLPGTPRETVLSAFDPEHSRNRERLFMWKAGIEIFRDHPLTGVGLAGMKEIYLRYQSPDSREKAVHLHSVPIQVLASMGIVGFAAWVYLFGSLFAWLLRARGRVRDGPPVREGLVAAALSVWIAFMANGLVEWNLGDVEVITLFWTVTGLAASAAAAEGMKKGGQTRDRSPSALLQARVKSSTGTCS